MSQTDPNLLYARANQKESDTAVLHLRFAGTSRDIALEIIGLTADSPDQDIRLACANFLDLPVSKLDRLVIERHANGNLTLRPEALFG